MVINETVQATLDLAKSNAYTPSLIILFSTLLICLAVVGIVFKLASGKRGWGDFWGIWFFTVLITGIVMTFLVVSPSWISDTITKLTEFFK